MNTTYFHTVAKVPGGFAVLDFNGEALVAYRDRATTEKLATGYTLSLFTAAETYDERFVCARAYLATRKTRKDSTVEQLSFF